jgi:hypothetical protein
MTGTAMRRFRSGCFFFSLRQPSPCQ